MSLVWLQPRHGPPAAVRIEQLPQQGGGCYAVTLADRRLEVEADFVSDSSGVLGLPGRRLPFHVVRCNDGLDVWIAGRVYHFKTVQRTAQRRGRQEDRVAQSDSVLAPMPGSILDIRVAQGAEFEANQPLIIMESMKMEMSLSVPHAGSVAQVHCRVGQLVEQGARLISLVPRQSEQAGKAGS